MSRPGWRAEDAARVQTLPLRGPFAAQIGLGWAPIRPLSTVERAVLPGAVQIAAGGDHLRLDCILGLAGDFAEIRGLSRPDEALEAGIGPRAQDFDLQVTATGRAPFVVGGGTGGNGAGVNFFQLYDREGARRKGQPQAHHFLAGDDPEVISADSPGLCPTAASWGHWAKVTVGGTSGGSWGISGLQVAAPHVEHRVDHQVAALGPELGEADLGGVAQEPCGFMIERIRRLLQRADPEGYGELLALGAEGAARRDRGHPANLNARGPSPGFRGTVVCS